MSRRPLRDRPVASQSAASGAEEAQPKKRRGRPPLPPGSRVRDRKQLSLRLPDAEVLVRFKAMTEQNELRPEELFAELVNLVPGDTLARLLSMAEAQRVTPGVLLQRLALAEWAVRGYRWR